MLIVLTNKEIFLINQNNVQNLNKYELIFRKKIRWDSNFFPVLRKCPNKSKVSKLFRLMSKLIKKILKINQIIYPNQ